MRACATWHNGTPQSRARAPVYGARARALAMSRADGDVSDNSSVASEGDWYDAIAAGEVIGRFLDAIQAAGAMAAPSMATDVVDGTRAPTSDAAAMARRRAVLFRAADACDGLVSKVRESAVYAEEAGKAGARDALLAAKRACAADTEAPFRAKIDAAIEACEAAALAAMERVKTYRFEGNVEVKIIETGLSNGVGAKIWHAAKTLSKMLIADAALVRDKDVLELGAGVGMCGFVAARLGARSVTLSDFEEPLLLALEKSAELNGAGSVARVCALDWTKEVAGEDTPSSSPARTLDAHAQFDVLLGSDVLYESQHVLALPACVARRMRADGACILVNAVRYRDMFDDLLAACADVGLHVDVIDTASGDGVEQRASWHDGAERALRLTKSKP